jgi:hypothetical protein
MLSFLLVVVVPDTTTPHILDIVFIRYVNWHPLCLGSFSYTWFLSYIHCKTQYLLGQFHVVNYIESVGLEVVNKKIFA